MKVLVTGGCGFLGSHVCEYYKRKGEQVIALDNLTKHELRRTWYNVREARNYNKEYLERLGVKIVKADIRRKWWIDTIAKDCDFIVHTAAQPAMTISIEDPELDFTTNVIGSFNVLEACRKYDIPVVTCSTIHVYGNRINRVLREEETRFKCYPASISEKHELLRGDLTPLHASKRSMEIYFQTYMDCYGLEAAVFRLTGIYGTRQIGGLDHGWVSNFAIRTVLGKTIWIYGTDKQVRDIIYVTDVCEAIDKFHYYREKGIYNIGGGLEFSISLLSLIHI